MSVADKARKVVQDLTGMWWPDADEGGLREAARAWRAFAEDVEDIQAVANKAARALIEDNKGQSIDAFGETLLKLTFLSKFAAVAHAVA